MTAERFRLKPAVHVLLVRDDHVLLLRREHTGYEDGNYSVIAGHLDGGEEVKTAAIREAREEAGIAIAPDNLRVVGVMHRFSQRATGPDERINFFVAAERWSGAIVNAEPEKCGDLSWFAVDALPSNTIPYVRRAIANYRAGRWFDSFGWESANVSQTMAPRDEENGERSAPA
jgi:8-oxo-dGTP pyrophosphatase MutT (NUDIX family)